MLHEKGLVARATNRGYFLAQRPDGPTHHVLAALGLRGADDEGDSLYLRIADDRLRGVLPDTFTESLLRKTYGVAQGEVDAVLGRIEVFAIDADTGRLTHLQSRPSEGRTPRFFALHPDGGFVYALNEDSDTVVTLAVDRTDGRLGDACATLRCGSPVCMVFTRPASPARP